VRQLQKLAVLLGAITIGLLGMQDVCGAASPHPAVTSRVGTSTMARTPEAVGSMSDGTNCGTTSNGCGRSARDTLAGNSQDTIGHTSPAPSTTTSSDLALSGMDIMAMFIAVLALVALGFLILIFTRRRTVSP
jgi:hypothetical protein